MAPSDLAHLTIDDRVATLSLNRPDARNALSIDLLEALHTQMDAVESLCAQPDRPVVLVVTGEGKSFCAGMDLKAVLGNAELARTLLTRLAELTLRIRAIPMVTVASVNGAAIGGGCGLSCVCDISISHVDAKLGFPEVDLGVCPAVVAPWVVRKLGASRARQVLLSGGLMTGQRGHEIGLINHCVASRNDLAARTVEITHAIASGGAMALAATKGLLNELDHSLDRDIVLKGAQLSADVLSTDEAQQRLSAALKK
ncbi:MAG: enoyl-CoA hydratase/isomerase family protein [Phycisphaeraceae bacterium]|nr:enoyl-CoA hydratase/isomerase family protein [Phycisphaerales bacterium]MCB9861445.1 enoyl-CoA hydratase/isomerase family protein [Phycisphaeraceae bacterium]